MTVDNGDHPEPTLAGTVDAFRAVWSLFTAIELGDDEGKDLLLNEYDTWTLLHGWHVTAARLRQVLREHAETVGCYCGTDEWLADERLRLAMIQGDESDGG
jgi:hypothetical protein